MNEWFPAVNSFFSNMLNSSHDKTIMETTDSHVRICQISEQTLVKLESLLKQIITFLQEESHIIVVAKNEVEEINEKLICQLDSVVNIFSSLNY
jgi:hypothetical protein